jgi:hypothetical protein
VARIPELIVAEVVVLAVGAAGAAVHAAHAMAAVDQRATTPRN